MAKYIFLTPSFKVHYLRKSLQSIKNQSYHNFLCIVSDDCSPECIEYIYDKVVDDDPRFTYRRNEENMGGKSLVSHWNMLVDMCDSEYFIMASDDDIYSTNFLQEIDDLVTKYPGVDVIRAKAKKIRGEHILQEDGDIPEFMTQEEFLEYFGKKPMVHCLANYVFKTSALKLIGGFPDFPKAGYSDSAAAMALAKNGIATTKNVLFSFRMSEENLSSENGYNKYTEEGIIGCIQFADWFKDNIRPYVNYGDKIKYAHYNHVVDIAQYFMCRLPFCKAIKYYWALRKRGYMNFKSTLTAIKNWIKVS